MIGSAFLYLVDVTIYDGGVGMNYLAIRLMHFASILRIIAGIALLGVITYGVYILIFESSVIGTFWIVPTIVFGWVANWIFNMMCLLISGMGATSVRR
jgi:hypothetical protein